MIEVTSNLREIPADRPTQMIARSARETEFQDALDRYLADDRRRQALITRPDNSRLGAKLPLQRRIANWLNGQFGGCSAPRFTGPPATGFGL